METEDRAPAALTIVGLDEHVKALMMDYFIREVAPVLEDKTVRRFAREEIASVMAACLADPQVDEHAKSLAGYILQRLGEPGE